jgi:hypothetical protein
MPNFSDAFLDEIRAALPVSELVGKYLTLKKEGVEYVALSPFNQEKTPSFKVNDKKGFWKCFSSGKAGDVFKFLTEAQGRSFPEAVEECARLAGIPLPDGKGSPGKAGGGAGGKQKAAGGSSDRRVKRSVVAGYDYTDAHGRLIYQVVRFEPKGFAQRRPYDGEAGCWVWGLDDGEYMRKGPGKDWQRFDADKFEEWKFTEKKKIGGAVEHSLYNLPALLDAIDGGETVYLPEGEKDCGTFEAWDLIASTNSGGAKYWNEKHAATFTGADVVIPVDNDGPGRERGHMIAASLKGKAKRTRILDIAQHWTACPDKGDLTDWRAAGGTREALLEIVAKLPDWKPEPPVSSFGAVRFIDLDLPAREHEWLIKGILPRGGVGMVLGKWQSGKSFFAVDMSVAISDPDAEPYMGRKTVHGLVIYQAGEAGLGMKLRLRAARSYRGIAPDKNIPFVLMPQPLNMYASEDPVNKFIAECKQWSAYYEMPVEMAVIDTFSAATPGANENSSEHVSMILDRGNRIARELGGMCLWVHHLNAAGEKARGHSSLMGNVDTVIEISETENIDRESVEGREITRTIRHATVIKQKEAERGFHWPFVLKQVREGVDADGDPRTTCIVAPPHEAIEPPKDKSVPSSRGAIALTDERANLFRALLEAIDRAGVPPPVGLSAPPSVRLVVEWGKFRYAYRKRVAPDDENAKKAADTIKSRLRRFQEWGLAAGIIRVETMPVEGGDVAYVWPTGKPVFGRQFSWPKKKEPEAAPVDTVTGQDIVDLDGDKPGKGWF